MMESALQIAEDALVACIEGDEYGRPEAAEDLKLIVQALRRELDEALGLR